MPPTTHSVNSTGDGPQRNTTHSHGPQKSHLGPLTHQQTGVSRFQVLEDLPDEPNLELVVANLKQQISALSGSSYSKLVGSTHGQPNLQTKSKTKRGSRGGAQMLMQNSIDSGGQTKLQSQRADKRSGKEPASQDPDPVLRLLPQRATGGYL